MDSLCITFSKKHFLRFFASFCYVFSLFFNVSSFFLSYPQIIHIFVFLLWILLFSFFELSTVYPQFFVTYQHIHKLWISALWILWITSLIVIISTSWLWISLWISLLTFLIIHIIHKLWISFIHTLLIKLSTACL